MPCSTRNNITKERLEQDAKIGRRLFALIDKAERTADEDQERAYLHDLYYFENDDIRTYYKTL